MRFKPFRSLAPIPAAWRPLAEYALTAAWSKPGQWFYGERLICDLLGFGNEAALVRLPLGAALRMKDVYERWAATHLDRDEESLVRFAWFLTTDFGAPLRLEGLHRIAAMLRATTKEGHWYREGTGEALVDLAATALRSSDENLARDALARQALIDILALLALALVVARRRIGATGSAETPERPE